MSRLNRFQKPTALDGRAAVQNQKMAANDADDAYVMDLSERHLSSRGLHESALARLQRVLHDEGRSGDVKSVSHWNCSARRKTWQRGSLPDRKAAANQSHHAGRRRPSRLFGLAQLLDHRPTRLLLDMMMALQDDDDETVEDEDVYEEPPPPPPPLPRVVGGLLRIVVLDLAGNRLRRPDATPSSAIVVAEVRTRAAGSGLEALLFGFSRKSRRGPSSSAYLQRSEVL